MNALADRFEAETAELPALTAEEMELAQMRKTPPQGHPVVSCTDPAYVAYLERQLMASHAATEIANSAADSARAVFHAVGANNAALTEEVAALRVKLQAALETVVKLQAELLAKGQGQASG